MKSRYATVTLVAAVAVVAAIAWNAATSRSGYSAEGDDGKPNIILIVTDDQTYESLSKMPYLSSREDWIFFDSAFWNVSLCCPARSTILTGQYDTHTGVITNNPEWGIEAFDNRETLAVWLDRAGYKTALFGKYLNGYKARPADPPPGWDKWFAFAGESDYYGFTINNDGERVKYKGKTEDDYSTDMLLKEAVTFIQDAGRDPFFLYWAPKTPHTPFIAAKRHIGRFANEPIDENPNINEEDVSDKPEYIRTRELFPREKADANRRDQWEMLLAVDEAIEKFETVLKEEGKADNTLVIFLSDNGYTFGEHRLGGKRCAYDACMRVPFAIRYPGAKGGHIADLVTNPDLAPTIAELTGAEIPISVDGVSLVPLLKGERPPSWREAVLGHWGGADTVIPGIPNYWSVRTSGYRYTEYVTGEKELYDYAADPYELANLADDPAYKDLQADLKVRLDSLVAEAQAPSRGADGKMKPAAPDLSLTDGKTGIDDADD